MRNMLIPGRWRRATRRPVPRQASPPAERPANALPDQDLAETVRHLLAERRRRAELFGADLFADPAWEIMLELFLAAETNVRAPLARVGTAAGVPGMAARRWIDVLEERGLLRKLPDREAPERMLVDLAPDARDMMRRHLREMLA